MREEQGQLKFFDMFSGIGGFKIAMEKAGFKCIGYCDNDKYATQLYREYFNTREEMYYNDATKIKTEELPDFDILCAGFPCQTFSVCGKRRGFSESRGTMFFEVARILRDKKPKYFILENVRGLLNHEGGRTFATIIKILTDLGYSTQWQILNSKFFDVPHNRERVYIVGCLGKDCAGEIFPIRSKNTKSYSKLKIITVNKGDSQSDTVYSTKGICGCLTTKSGTYITKTDVHLYKQKQDIIDRKIKVRKLTPLECFRLQGFPDDMVKKAYELGISNTQLYKMAGNTVTVDTVYAVAKKIADFEQSVEVEKCPI